MLIHLDSGPSLSKPSKSLSSFELDCQCNSSPLATVFRRVKQVDRGDTLIDVECEYPELTKAERLHVDKVVRQVLDHPGIAVFAFPLVDGLDG